jgi:hypothetical protein
MNETTSEQETPIPDTTAESGFPFWRMAGIATFCALIVTVSGLSIDHAFLRKTQLFGTVDIGNIIQVNQMRLMNQGLSPSATDKDRAAIFNEAKNFGAQLIDALNKTQNECGCVLLTRAAVVGGGGVDYTYQVKAKLGLQDYDLDRLKKQFDQIESQTAKLPNPQNQLPSPQTNH